MPGESLNLINFHSDKDIQESLRLALMFKEEIDAATQSLLDMIQIAGDPGINNSEDFARFLQEAVNAALLTGIRTYRSWMQSEGVNVQGVEESSGKDIPADFFHGSARYPL